MLLCIAQAIEKFFWLLFNLKNKTSYFVFASWQCCKSRKNTLTQVDRALGIEQSYCTNMVAKIDTDFQIKEQMRLKITSVLIQNDEIPVIF